MLKNGYYGNDGFIFTGDLGVIFLGIPNLVNSSFSKKNIFFSNFGLKGVVEKCVGCFLVYLFWGVHFFIERYYGMRGLIFCAKLICWFAAKHTTVKCYTPTTEIPVDVRVVANSLQEKQLFYKNAERKYHIHVIFPI